MSCAASCSGGAWGDPALSACPVPLCTHVEHEQVPQRAHVPQPGLVPPLGAEAVVAWAGHGSRTPDISCHAVALCMQRGRTETLCRALCRHMGPEQQHLEVRTVKEVICPAPHQPHTAAAHAGGPCTDRRSAPRRTRRRRLTPGPPAGWCMRPGRVAWPTGKPAYSSSLPAEVQAGAQAGARRAPCRHGRHRQPGTHRPEHSGHVLQPRGQVHACSRKGGEAVSVGLRCGQLVSTSCLGPATGVSPLEPSRRSGLLTKVCGGHGGADDAEAHDGYQHIYAQDPVPAFSDIMEGWSRRSQPLLGKPGRSQS